MNISKTPRFSNTFINSLIHKLFFLLTALLTAAFILSFSIAAPILIRPFYYAQIDIRNLESETGFEREQIKGAYDDMLDYCIGISSEFGTGDLKWSESGKSHFSDVKVLFMLDLRVLAISTVLLTAYFIYKKTQKSSCTYNRYSPLFWGASGLLLIFIIIGGLCALNFNYAFTVFHEVFFPGKDNWLFDPQTDEIIKILPEEFFASCAVLILIILVTLCMTTIVLALKHNRKKTI